jgi:hypothetical protein
MTRMKLSILALQAWHYEPKTTLGGGRFNNRPRIVVFPFKHCHQIRTSASDTRDSVVAPMADFQPTNQPCFRWVAFNCRLGFSGTR